jgi:hypothetical protein
MLATCQKLFDSSGANARFDEDYDRNLLLLVDPIDILDIGMVSSTSQLTEATLGLFDCLSESPRRDSIQLRNKTTEEARQRFCLCKTTPCLLSCCCATKMQLSGAEFYLLSLKRATPVLYLQHVSCACTCATF